MVLLGDTDEEKEVEKGSLKQMHYSSYWLLG
jgi:hypothetical protein